MSTPEEKALQKFSKETLIRLYIKARAKAEKYDELKKLLKEMVNEDE